MPSNVEETLDDIDENTLVTELYTQSTAAFAAVLMDSHTPEIVEDIPFQIEETTPATVVNTVETMLHTVLMYQVTAVTIPLHAADAAAEIASHTPCRNATIPVNTAVADAASACHAAAI